MNTVTRAHLAETDLHARLVFPGTNRRICWRGVLDRLSAALEAGESVKISGFGTFSVRQKGRRVGRNPENRRRGANPARRVLVFRPSQVLKAR